MRKLSNYSIIIKLYQLHDLEYFIYICIRSFFNYNNTKALTYFLRGESGKIQHYAKNKNYAHAMAWAVLICIMASRANPQ
jgi:hypothetical protein